MKAKNKEKEKYDPVRDYSNRKRGYYFHADEDFREDWEWGKTKSTKSPGNQLPKKGIPDIFIS